MGIGKKAKRKRFLDRYKASTEKHRIKEAYYRNKVRLVLFCRKMEIEHGLLAGERI